MASDPPSNGDPFEGIPPFDAYLPDKERIQHNIKDDQALLDAENASSIVYGKALPILEPDKDYIVPGKFTYLKAGLEEYDRRKNRPTKDDPPLPDNHMDCPLVMLDDILREIENHETVVEVYYRSREKKHEDAELQLLTPDSRNCLWSSDQLICNETVRSLLLSQRYGRPPSEAKALMVKHTEKHKEKQHMYHPRH